MRTYAEARTLAMNRIPYQGHGDHPIVLTVDVADGAPCIEGVTTVLPIIEGAAHDKNLFRYTQHGPDYLHLPRFAFKILRFARFVALMPFQLERTLYGMETSLSSLGK